MFMNIYMSACLPTVIDMAIRVERYRGRKSYDRYMVAGNSCSVICINGK